MFKRRPRYAQEAGRDGKEAYAILLYRTRMENPSGSGSTVSTIGCMVPVCLTP
ncbi:MAG TPA: hypothetical protein VFV38_30080 [Ktedonobacteraceae bacterium]|nr:hypothetical protein [Ktedonobacteraceae bacterium]